MFFLFYFTSQPSKYTSKGNINRARKFRVSAAKGYDQWNWISSKKKFFRAQPWNKSPICYTLWANTITIKRFFRAPKYYNFVIIQITFREFFLFFVRFQNKSDVKIEVKQVQEMTSRLTDVFFLALQWLFAYSDFSILVAVFKSFWKK